MANLQALLIELDAGHPDTAAYDANHQLAADQINVVNRTVDKTSMTPDEIFQAVDAMEYAALSAAQKTEFYQSLTMGVGSGINPFGNIVNVFTGIFGQPSETLTALAILRKLAVSRAQELNIGKVAAGTVEMARAL